MTTLTDFLAAFFPDEDEKIYLRAFKAKGASDKPDNRPMVKDTTRRKLAADTKLQAKMTNVNKTRGWYFVVNAGGNADADITRFNAFFCECDDLPIAEQHTLLDRAPIPTSIRIETLKSVHAYWLKDSDCSETQWRDVQTRLIAFFNSDTTIKNPSRVMRLPFFNYVFVNNESYGYKKVELKQFDSERRYSVEAMLEAFPPVEVNAQAKADGVEHSRASSGFANWPALKAELGRRVMAHPKAKQNKQGKWDYRGICHGGKGSSGLFYDPATNGTYCNKNCDEATILRAFGLPDRPDSEDTESGSATDFNLRAQAIISADSAERDDLIRLLVSDLIYDADSLTIDRIGMIFKEAKVLSLTLWRQLVKYEREHKREKQKITAQEQDEAKRAARLQELVKTECDLTTIHRKLTYTTSSPYSHDVIELAIATSISHQLVKEVLLWLLIVGPPSSDKTQTALAIKDAPQVFHLDTLTENSFISGFISPDGSSPQDLLAELDERCLTIKDLNAMFSQHPDKVAKVLGDLTAIYDEEFSKWTGTRGDVRYKARFSLIGCVTPLALAQHHRYMSMVGARFLSYRVAELAAQAVEAGFDTIWMGNGESKAEIRKLASAYATQLHHQIAQGTVCTPTFSADAKRRLNTLARFLAYARAAVRTQRSDITTDDGKNITRYDIVEIQREEPFRALLQLRALSTALAIVHRRNEITEHELELCRRVVLSSMPHDRSLILALFQNSTHLTQNNGLTRKSAAEGVGKARNHAVRLLTELEAIGVLKGEKTRDEEQNIDVWTYYPSSNEFTDILMKEILPLDHSGDLESFSSGSGAVLCQPDLTQNCATGGEKKDGLEVAEVLSQLSSANIKESCESIRIGRAIWRNKDNDQQVEVIGDRGIGSDKRRYVRIAESETAIPADELIYEENDWGEV